MRRRRFEVGENPKEVYEMLKAAGRDIPDELAAMVNAPKAKYNNVKTEYNGEMYDSAKEAQRAHELRMMQQQGQIIGYFTQVPFMLAAKIVYVADFVVLEMGGTWRVEDVKSPHTRTLAPYRMKRKLFKERYGFDIQEV